MNLRKTLPATAIAACGTLLCQLAIADVTIPFNEYSGSPSIGNGAGTSTDPRNPGYGAMKIFIQKVIDYTDDQGPDALPPGQKVVFQRSQGTGRAVSALRAGVQFANANATPAPVFSDPSWGFVYNSVPFGMTFGQMLRFLYDTRIEGFGGNGLELAQSVLDSRGGTQVVFPVVGSTMQGRGTFRSRSASRSATPATPIARARAMASGWPGCARRAGGSGTFRRRRTSSTVPATCW